MEVSVPTTQCSQWHQFLKLVSSVDARCRDPLLWKGGAMHYKPGRWMKAANQVRCIIYLSEAILILRVLKSDDGSGIVKLHTCFFECSEHWCTINELGKSWTARIDLIEEVHTHLVDLRGVDGDYKFLQILGNAFELKFVEIGKDGAFWWR